VEPLGPYTPPSLFGQTVSLLWTERRLVIKKPSPVLVRKAFLPIVHADIPGNAVRLPSALHEPLPVW